MSSLGTYSFLPWLRQGIANTIASPDNDAGVKTRASVHVALQVAGDPVTGTTELSAPLAQDIALYGPGDIIGIDSRAIFRTDPRPWITNYESNYLAAVEFYDEDFLWRYTPAAPDRSGLRLRPWLTLVVLQESEFSEDQSVGRPLPCIAIPDHGALSPADELWAWAHVHFNQSVAGSDSEHVSPDMGAVLPRVQSIIAGNPDLAYSRLICPRRLDDNAGYHAFVVPTFETGRLAGIGKDPTLAPNATYSAWGAPYAGQSDAAIMPVYFRWYFRTGSKGDFEYLVTLLKPQPIDTRVGTRDMDVQDPGSNIPGIADPALGGVLPLGGALRVPDADLNVVDLAKRQKYENWDQPYPHPFQTALAAFVNLPDDYSQQTAGAAPAHQTRRHARRQSHQLGTQDQSRPAFPGARELRHRCGRDQCRNVHELCLATDRRRPRRQPEDQTSSTRDRSLDGLVPAPPHPACCRQCRARLHAVGAGRRPLADGRLDHRVHAKS
jgi:hypothetical protein